MPWCPNCKIEYKDGVSLCADCGQSLVDSLEDINDAEELCLCKEEETAKKDVMENEDADLATKNLRSAPSVSYVKKREQYQDLKSTAWMFFGFGILVLVFVILHLLKILTLFSGILSHIMLALMGFGMIYVGINSFLKAKKAAGEAVEEEALTEKINAFLQEKMTEEYVTRIKDENQSEEINFLNIMEHIKEDLKLYFGEMDESYLDQLAEEFYNQHFEDNRSAHRY